MKELFRAGAETPVATDPIAAEMMVKEKQVEEAKAILAKAGFTRDKYPELYLTIEEALDQAEQDAYAQASGAEEN